MAYDPDDTIAAIGTATGAAARGMVRISGPQTIDCVTRCFCVNDKNDTFRDSRLPSVHSGTISCSGQNLEIPGELFLWPTSRSFTRQPLAELHTFGSPPVLEAILQEVCKSEVRLAEPGEFTLRAFLAGRIDLTQAEAVLGVIDASDQQSHHTALTQLAGGLSQPLTQLREQLLSILAELEAGLDFVEEDIEFISAEALQNQLSQAKQTVAATLDQMSSRTDTQDLPRIVLLGPPNAGKSSLFNALIAENQHQPAIVSEQAGTTRDYVTANLDLDGIACELVDTAGQESVQGLSIEQAAQEMTSKQQQQAHLKLYCNESYDEQLENEQEDASIFVQTKADLADRPSQDSRVITCSSKTGLGLENLRKQIRTRLATLQQYDGGVVASTSARCQESLLEAQHSLIRGIELAKHAGGEELIAAEVRGALTQIGRVVGAVYTDDVLDRIFSQFCIGK